MSVDLRDLGDRTAEIDRLLVEMDATAVTVDANADSLATIFDSSTVHYWRRLAVDVVSHIGQILPSVGSLYEGGLWLIPMFESLADTTDVSRGGRNLLVGGPPHCYFARVRAAERGGDPVDVSSWVLLLGDTVGR